MPPPLPPVTEEGVRIPGAGAGELAGVITLPAQGSDKGCMVLVHGGMSHKNSAYQPALAAHAAADGYTVLRYDWCGCGDSPGSRNMMAGFWDNVADLRACLRWVRRSRGLRVACVVGHSAGAQLALQMAARHPAEAPPSIVAVHPRFHLRYWLEEWERQVAAKGEWVLRWRDSGRRREHRVSRDDAAAYAAVDMAAACAALPAAVRVMTVHGFVQPSAAPPPAPGKGAAQQQPAAPPRRGATAAIGYAAREQTCDGVVPLRDVPEIANRVAGHRLALLAGVGHYYKERGSSEQLWQAVRDWLAGGCAPTPPGSKL
eukprot:TRINITY_DN51062_c0_g1_i1.p2 TRINITY_DN51062_c0_g1~~TRINITY_DN51062_c0_g1_i1.p2  ORF type:complete len:341 (+),score=101.87 TRINITY_DN51062_c0_g1_i1:79-1023(+)